MHFSTILDWDKWQKTEWQKRLSNATESELIYEEPHQIVSTIVKNRKKLLSDDATILLYKDRFEIILGGETRLILPHKDINLVLNVSIEALIIINDDFYLYIQSQRPRAAAKYVTAWRTLLGKKHI
ncbi:MAG: hypothetical protein UH249_10135 [Acutalibacteraceae bacterium]|nr:hypothetical protein [Acutalibacteraceae bacterium]